MAALRFLRARTATSLAVTAAVGVSTAWIASSPPSLAASAHARGPAGDPARGPALRGPTKHAPPPGSPVSNPSTTPPVRTTARGLPSAAGAGAPAGTSESPQRPEHLSSRSANLSAREQRGRDGDPHRSHDSNPRAALSSPGIGPTQAKGRAPHGPAPAAEVSQAGEPAAQTLREPAVAGKGPAGPKQGGNGKHAKAAGGKHKVPSGVATRASSPSAGADAGSAPKGAAARLTSAGNATAALPTGSVQAATAAAAPAPSVALVPQIAGVVTQPAGESAQRARGRGAHATAAPAAGAALLSALVTTAATGPAAGAAPTTAVHPAAARTGARTHRSRNPLERIGRRIPLPIPVPDWSKPIIIALLILAVWLGIRASLAGARARRLERQRARLLRDVTAMQTALVPEVPSQLGGLHVSVAYRPAEGPAAGGDFYDLFIPEPGTVAMMLGDVSGHGHEAITHAALTRYTLRAYLQAGLEPRMALALAGRVLADPAGEHYATVAVGLYEAARGTLTYALAGHPPPMLLGLSEQEPVTACSSPPVGWGIPTGRRQTTISLAAGTAVCLFSDGLIEARREGQLLGREHLREILASLGPRPVAEELLAEVRAAAQGVPDDMVACVLSPRVSAHNEQVHIEELEVDATALARAGVRRFLNECSVPPAEITRALRSAADTASAAGTAVLRVTLGPEETSVTVSAAGTPAWQSASAHRGASVEGLQARAPEPMTASGARARAVA